MTVEGAARVDDVTVVRCSTTLRLWCGLATTVGSRGMGLNDGGWTQHDIHRVEQGGGGARRSTLAAARRGGGVVRLYGGRQRLAMGLSKEEGGELGGGTAWRKESSSSGWRAKEEERRRIRSWCRGAAAMAFIAAQARVPKGAGNPPSSVLG